MRISDWSSDVCSSDLDDGGNLTALAGTRAVAKEEYGPVRATVLVRRERQPFLGRLEQTGDVALERVAGADQRLELSVGQHQVVDYTSWQLRNEKQPRSRNRANHPTHPPPPHPPPRPHT